jgi:predicted phosphodiesterase
VFSDVHGNLRALDACLADLREQGGADVLVGAGDYCMDGPRPREVLERLFGLGAHCVRGNTDRYLSDPLFGEDDVDGDSLRWYRDRLGAEWLSKLAALPFAQRFGLDGTAPQDALLVVHANPLSDDEHLRPDADDAFLERITADVVERTIAFGHLHVPYVRHWRDRMFVDVASAGLPKDGDPRACYALFMQRSGGWEVKHRRVVFDVEKVAREIRKSGMPERKKRVGVLRRHRYREFDERIP